MPTGIESRQKLKESISGKMGPVIDQNPLIKLQTPIPIQKGAATIYIIPKNRAVPEFEEGFDF